MATVSILTPYQALSLNEAIQGDYTHKAIIKAADVNALGATTTPGTFNLVNLPAGYVVTNPAMCVVTPFTWSNASIVVATVAFGDGSSTTTYLSASNVIGTGGTTPVTALVTVYSASVSVAYAATTNSQLKATMAITASQNFNTCTAGEVHIFWQQRLLSELCYPQQ